MHSHDRTLLAKLGFSDPDKKDSLHDLACQYLIEETQAKALVARLDPKTLVANSGSGLCNYARIGYHADQSCNPGCGYGLSFSSALERDLPRLKVERRDMAVHLAKAELERLLSKGQGQYKTTIGFVDAMVSYAYTATVVEETTNYKQPEGCGWGEPSGPPRVAVSRQTSEKQIIHSGNIGIEVKIAPCSSGEILRQIKLYREYLDMEPGFHSTIWVAAVAFAVTTDFVESLKRENVRVVRLGAAFATWVESRKTSASTAAVDEV